MGTILDDHPWDIYERDELEEEKDIDEYKQIEAILDSIDKVLVDGEDDILIEPIRELPTDAVPADSVQENRDTEDKI